MTLTTAITENPHNLMNSLKTKLLLGFVALGIAASANISFATTTTNTIPCAYWVAYGKFNLGQWSNADGTVVVSEPEVGSFDEIYDHDTLKDKLGEYKDDCDETAKKLTDRAQALFPSQSTQISNFFSSAATSCKNSFQNRYDQLSDILCE